MQYKGFEITLSESPSFKYEGQTIKSDRMIYCAKSSKFTTYALTPQETLDMQYKAIDELTE